MEAVKMTTREEVEHQYSPSRWSHRLGAEEILELHVRTVEQGSHVARTSADCELDVPYGLTEREKLDIFGSKTLPGEAPIFVFLHGGYWQKMSREQSSYMAPTFCAAGALVVVVGYELTPNIDIPGIVNQVKKAVAYVLNMAKRRGSSGVYLGGHSAGGQLSAMMLAQNWMEECMVSPSLIKGAILIAGVYDLTPLVDTYVNDAVRMTHDVAVSNSPMSHVDKIAEYSTNRRIIVALGQHESPAFHLQNAKFNNKLIEGGINTTMVVVPDCDHFNVVENLAKPDYILTQEVLKMMGLNIGNIVDQMHAAGIS